MSKRFWRRLAGCIATSLTLTAATPEYRAGAVHSDHVRAVVLEDRAGHRAVFAEAEFPVTRAIADFVALQIIKSHELDRGSIVVSGIGPASPDAAALTAAIERAFADLAPATLTVDGVVSIRTANGCVAIPLRADCGPHGAPLHGPIRSAFQMVDLPHPLQTRDATPQTYPVQAIAIGKTTLLALDGNAPALQPTVPLPDEPRVRDAVARVLRRVR